MEVFQDNVGTDPVGAFRQARRGIGAALIEPYANTDAINYASGGDQAA